MTSIKPVWWCHEVKTLFSISSHGIFPGPLLGKLSVPLPVRLVDPSYLRHQRVVRVGVTQQGTDGQQHLADSESWGPLRSENVETDWTIWVDVWMVDPGCERNLRRFEWVVSGEVNSEKEDPSLVGWLWGSHDSGLPVEQVISYWTCWALRWRVTTQVLKFFVDAF